MLRSNQYYFPLAAETSQTSVSSSSSSPSASSSASSSLAASHISTALSDSTYRDEEIIEFLKNIDSIRYDFFNLFNETLHSQNAALYLRIRDSLNRRLSKESDPLIQKLTDALRQLR